MLFYISSIPFLSLALVAWAVATRHLTDGVRRLSMVAAIVLACAPWTMVRTAGVGGSGSEFHWRWTPTPEQRLLAQTGGEPEPLPPPPAPAESPARASGGVRRQRQSNRPPSRRQSSAVPAPAPAAPQRASDQASRVARLSRTRARRRHPRRAHRDRLVRVAARPDVAPANRTGLVVLRGQRRSPLHAGAARRRRDRRQLQSVHRRAGVATPRPRAVLGVRGRCRSARDADPQPTVASMPLARPES